ncbi:hypothetical protein A5666_17685 [Mycolicibacterium fortuitum]|nr:hypothetical protein A5665_03415 [Mycolicibacterium fortuitum]OBI59432.1 hypothetical protein A5666_17685 [Mycolicibacterium fortuitum]
MFCRKFLGCDAIGIRVPVVRMRVIRWFVWVVRRVLRRLRSVAIWPWMCVRPRTRAGAVLLTLRHVPGVVSLRVRGLVAGLRLHLLG